MSSNGDIPASANGAAPSAPMPDAAAAAAAAAATPGAAQPQRSGMASLPPQMQQVLLGLNKERLGQLVQRMHQLKTAGETEQTSQEYANLVNILRAFQQFQAMRQQQLQQQQKQAQDGSAAASTPAASAGPLSAPASATAVPAPAASVANGTSTPAPTAGTPAASAAPTTTAAPATDSSSTTTTTTADGAAPVTPATAAATPAEGVPKQAVFTPDQVSALKTQIIAFKMISRNIPVPPHIQSAIWGPGKAIEDIKATLPDTSSLGPAGPIAEAAAASHVAAEALKAGDSSKGKEGSNGSTPAPAAAEVIPRPPSPKHDPSSAVYPYNAFRQPFTYLSKPTMGPEDFTATKQQRLLVPSLMPAGLDPLVLYQERNRFCNARMQQRIRELEGLPANIPQGPTLRGATAAAAAAGKGKAREDGHADIFGDASLEEDNAKIKLLIELKSLKLLAKQRALRQQIVSNMAKASALAADRTAFKRFKKQTLRDARMTETLERKQRAEREKRTRQKHVEYLNTICVHGLNLVTAHRAQQQAAQRIGKAVLKFHVDTEKEEQRRVERIAKERLNALKADDEEAYLKLIDTAKDTRITHLIRQTDAYLDSLAQAVQAQQNDDVHADAIAAERAGLPPPSLEDNPNQQIGIAVDETMFGAQRQDDPSDDKGKVDYYSVAHRITEVVTKQPSILVGGTLKAYQIKGLQWMVSLYNNRLNGILADEMGLGKTIQTISLITFLIEIKRQPGPYLVIVPLSTLTNWINEFEKWAPSVSTLIFKGPPLARRALTNRIRQGNFQVLLTTYEYIIKDKATLGKIKWTHMIIDEGHRMKNTQSKLTVTLTQFYTSRYRLLLTGTPLQNNLPELWALLNFVLPKIFNSVKSFDEWFNTPFANTGTTDGSMQLNEEEALLIIKRLHKVLRPFLLRRLKKDVESELPDKVEKVIRCKMSTLQRKLYQQMKNHKMLLAGEDPIAAAAGAAKKAKAQGIKGLQNAIMQLRKICNHPYVFEQVESAINPTKENGPDLYRVAGKFELLDRVLPKLKATGHRVLIFFQMTAIMDIMEDFLRYRNYQYLRLDGSTKPDDRSQLLKLFNAPGSEYFVFILSTRAGGLGLNLQTADTVIIYDSDWNPHQDLQAQDRAHRIGQKMEVRILRLVTEKSVEETILERAQDKLAIDGKVIQAGKFDNQATAAERESLLRAMLEADQDDDDDEDVDLGDEELNAILARGEHEVDRFRELDAARPKKDQEEWTARGMPGKCPAERLIQESELPSLYQQDFDAVNVLEDEVVEEEPAARRRNVVHYDDGLTEDQFLRALEDDDVDLSELVEKKRERAEKRRLKQLGLANADSQDGTPEPKGKKGGRKSLSKRGTETPEPSPAPGGRKRKRNIEATASPTPDPDPSPVTSRTKGRQSGGGFGGKRQRTGDDDKERLNLALLKCYRAMEGSVEEETGRKRCTLFLEVPRKQDYPDYHVLIAKPIALRQMKRRIDNRTYKSAQSMKEDVALMVSNAKTYNQEGSWVWNDAEELQVAFDKAWDSFIKGSDLPGADGDGSTGGGDDDDDEGSAGTPAVATPAARPKIKLSMKGRNSRRAVEDDE